MSQVAQLRDIIEAASGRTYEVRWCRPGVLAVENNDIYRELPMGPGYIEILRTDWPRGHWGSCWPEGWGGDGSNRWIAPSEPYPFGGLMGGGSWSVLYPPEREQAQGPFTYIEAASFAVGLMEQAYADDAYRRLGGEGDPLAPAELLK